MHKLLSGIKTHWPAIVAFGTAFWEKFGPGIGKYVQAHPHLSVYASLVAFTAAYYIKSPRQPQAENNSNSIFKS